MCEECELGARFLAVVHDMEAELDDFVRLGARTDLMPDREAIGYLIKANERLVEKQRHLLQLVSLLVEFTDLADLDPGPHLRLVDADHD